MNNLIHNKQYFFILIYFVRLHSEFVRLAFLHSHRETDRFFTVSPLKSRVGNILLQDTDVHITLNLDGVSVVSQTHTHPSHSETSRPLTSSVSFGVPLVGRSIVLEDRT